MEIKIGTKLQQLQLSNELAIQENNKAINDKNIFLFWFFLCIKQLFYAIIPDFLLMLAYVLHSLPICIL